MERGVGYGVLSYWSTEVHMYPPMTKKPQPYMSGICLGIVRTTWRLQ